jgi:hypothetical protein
VPVYHELSPEQIAKAVEGYDDELSAVAKADEAFYQLHSRCKRCQTQMVKQFDGRICFSPDHPLPKALLHCTKCGFLYNPWSDIVVNSGSAAHIPQEYERHYFKED